MLPPAMEPALASPPAQPPHASPRQQLSTLSRLPVGPLSAARIGAPSAAAAPPATTTAAAAPPAAAAVVVLDVSGHRVHTPGDTAVRLPLPQEKAQAPGHATLQVALPPLPLGLGLTLATRASAGA